VYGSTVAVGTSDLSNVAIYDDTGSFQDSVSVSGIKNVALYDSVLAAQTENIQCLESNGYLFTRYFHKCEDIFELDCSW
jgi:hypothetical protein